MTSDIVPDTLFRRAWGAQRRRARQMAHVACPRCAGRKVVPVVSMDLGQAADPYLSCPCRLSRAQWVVIAEQAQLLVEV